MRNVIAVLDDNVFFSAVLEKKFEKSNIIFKSTLDPFECINFLEEKQAIIFIIDINMPIISGFNVAQQIRQKEALLNIKPNEIILTSADNSFISQYEITKCSFIPKDVLLKNAHVILNKSILKE